MIVTVFGDIHGNLIALEQLFKNEQSKTDLFVCHGDVVNYGPWSNECVDYLNELKNVKLLKGNHEDYFITGNYPGENVIAKSFFNYCFPKFNSNSVEIIKEYESSIFIGQYKIQHTIENQYIFMDTDISKLMIENNYIIGHSHQQYSREKDNFKIYNTGSLGQNRKFINQSCYLQIDTKLNTVELKSFIHDINKVISKMKERKYPQICIDYYLSKSIV